MNSPLTVCFLWWFELGGEHEETKRCDVSKSNNFRTLTTFNPNHHPFKSCELHSSYYRCCTCTFVCIYAYHCQHAALLLISTMVAVSEWMVTPNCRKFSFGQWHTLRSKSFNYFLLFFLRLILLLLLHHHHRLHFLQHISGFSRKQPSNFSTIDWYAKRSTIKSKYLDDRDHLPSYFHFNHGPPNGLFGSMCKWAWEWIIIVAQQSLLIQFTAYLECNERAQCTTLHYKCIQRKTRAIQLTSAAATTLQTFRLTANFVFRCNTSITSKFYHYFRFVICFDNFVIISAFSP